MPVVHLPQALRKYADGQDSAAVGGETVAAAVAALTVAYPDLTIRLFDDNGRIHGHLAIIYRDAAVPRDELTTTPVEPDANIHVLIAVSGG